MITFLISMNVFLIFGATEKTWTDAHLVDCKFGVQLTKLGLAHTLCHSSCISLVLRTIMEWACTTSFVCMHKTGSKTLGANTFIGVD
jgi:hypothetical protein